jgi:hypothetical protein
MKKLVVLAGLTAVALFIGVASSAFTTGKAEARIKSIISFNPDVCFQLTGAVTPQEPLEDFVLEAFEETGQLPTTEEFAAYYGSYNCYGLNGYPVDGIIVNAPLPDSSPQLVILVFILQIPPSDALAEVADLLGGDVDNPDTYADLVEASDAQLGDESYVHTYDGECPLPFPITGSDVVTEGFNTQNGSTFPCFGASEPGQVGADGLPGTSGPAPGFEGLLGIFIEDGAPLATINSQSMWVLTFPTNDDPVHVVADEGVFLSSGDEDAIDDVLSFDDAGNHGEFVTVDLLFAGCVLNEGDGNDVECQDTPFDRTDMDLGAQQVHAFQGEEEVQVKAEETAFAAHDEELTLDYQVVGHPENIALTSLKSTIQTGTCADCDIDDIADEIGLPDVTLLLAKVTDDDKEALTGIWVLWTADSDKDVGSGKLNLAVPADVSIKSDAGIGAINLACGEGAGTFDVHAGVWWPDDYNFTDCEPVDDTGEFVCRFAELGGPFLLLDDMDFDDAHPTDVVTIQVIGGPASMTLTVSPASIECNGTNSAVVTATILNAAGKPVVAGTAVRFDVVALGTANPILTYTDANGQAKTTITPVANVTGGVTVIATVLGCCDSCSGQVFDQVTLQQSLVVSCTPQALPAAPAVEVVPPNTGDGGFLP